MKKNLYIELDTLIDTRLNMIIGLDKDLAIDWFNNGWKSRKSDTYSYLSTDTFTRLYENRDRDALTAPLTTHMIDLINDFAKKATLEDREAGGDGIITIFLNTYPYDLSDKELDALTIGFGCKFLDNVKIECIHMKDVSVGWVNLNVKMMIKYDGLKWLEKRNLFEGMSNTLPDTILVVPDIVNDNTMLKEDGKDVELNQLKEVLSPIIQVEFIDIGMFCFIG